MNTHTFHQATHITGIRTISSIHFLMSSGTTVLTACLILHIAGIFSDALFFSSWLCIYAKPLLNAVFALSLLLEYWIPLCRSAKLAACKCFSGTANRMHECCCQLVFVMEVTLGYVQYFIDLKYCFQFTACCFVVYRTVLTYNVSCHVWHLYYHICFQLCKYTEALKCQPLKGSPAPSFTISVKNNYKKTIWEKDFKYW